jgi:signal transduction histidine kinase
MAMGRALSALRNPLLPVMLPVQRSVLFNKQTYHTFVPRLCSKLFAPISPGNYELHRREFMTNVLLSGLSVLFSFRLIVPLLSMYHIGLAMDESAYLINIGLVIMTAGFWKWSRRGHTQAAAIGVLTLLYIEALSLAWQWSFEFPMAILMFTVVILCAGVLLSSRAALVVTAITAVSLLFISYVQIAGYMHPATYWLQQDFQMADASGYVAVLCVIALATWLLNSETRRSFLLTLQSEAALAKERDQLEITLRKRSQELEDMQLVYNLELQRFAEFGRLSAHLLHDIANPLNAATLHLESYTGANTASVKNARRSLKQLERYIKAARCQLRNHSEDTVFNVRQELKRVEIVMCPLAKNVGVSLHIEVENGLQLSGDAIKFNQIVSNLIANAIDAYQGVLGTALQKPIVVKALHHKNHIELSVHDWGRGIELENIGHIFQPFYSSKLADDRGLGIGLAIVKKMTENDFKGTIKAFSSPKNGTLFRLRMPTDTAIF